VRNDVKARADDERRDRSGHNHLVWAAELQKARRDVHADSSYVVIDEFHFSGVESCPLNDFDRLAASRVTSPRNRQLRPPEPN
jgi:hypothetical protein